MTDVYKDNAIRKLKEITKNQIADLFYDLDSRSTHLRRAAAEHIEEIIRWGFYFRSEIPDFFAKVQLDVVDTLITEIHWYLRDDSVVVTNCIACLCHYGRDAERAEPVLMECSYHTNEEVRVAAALALSEISWNAGAIVPRIIDLFPKGSLGARYHATRALEKFVPLKPEWLNKIIELAPRERDARNREVLIHLIARHGKDAKDVLPFARKQASHQRWPVRVAAACALLRISDENKDRKKAIAIIREFLEPGLCYTEAAEQVLEALTAAKNSGSEIKSLLADLASARVEVTEVDKDHAMRIQKRAVAEIN